MQSKLDQITTKESKYFAKHKIMENAVLNCNEKDEEVV